MSFGPIRVTIEGDRGPRGKTVVQLIIERALKDAGYAVTCIDSSQGFGVDEFERFTRPYAVIPEILRPVDVSIDI